MTKLITKEGVDLEARGIKLFFIIFFVLLLSGCGLTTNVYNNLGGRDAVLADVNEISKTVIRSNVRIEVTFSTTIYQGSGIIFEGSDNDYKVLTNAHLFEEGKRSLIKINDYCANRSYDATLIKIDYDMDMAILSFSGNSDKPLLACTFSDSYPSDSEIVYAIGNPLDQMNSITAGKYYGIVKDIEGYHSSMKMILSNTPIDHGNSGGMLLNQNLEVIGMNSVGLSIGNKSYSGSITFELLKEFIK